MREEAVERVVLGNIIKRRGFVGKVRTMADGRCLCKRSIQNEMRGEKWIKVQPMTEERDAWRK